MSSLRWIRALVVTGVLLTEVYTGRPDMVPDMVPRKGTDRVPRRKGTTAALTPTNIPTLTINTTPPPITANTPTTTLATALASTTTPSPTSTTAIATDPPTNSPDISISDTTKTAPTIPPSALPDSTSLGEGTVVTDVISAQPPEPAERQDMEDSQLISIIVPAVGAGLVVVMVAIIAFVMKRRRRNSGADETKKADDDMDNPVYNEHVVKNALGLDVDIKCLRDSAPDRPLPECPHSDLPGNEAKHGDSRRSLYPNAYVSFSELDLAAEVNQTTENPYDEIAAKASVPGQEMGCSMDTLPNEESQLVIENSLYSSQGNGEQDAEVPDAYSLAVACTLGTDIPDKDLSSSDQQVKRKASYDDIGVTGTAE